MIAPIVTFYAAQYGRLLPSCSYAIKECRQVPDIWLRDLWSTKGELVEKGGEHFRASKRFHSIHPLASPSCPEAFSGFHEYVFRFPTGQDDSFGISFQISQHPERR